MTFTVSTGGGKTVAVDFTVQREVKLREDLIVRFPMPVPGPRTHEKGSFCSQLVF